MTDQKTTAPCPEGCAGNDTIDSCRICYGTGVIHVEKGREFVLPVFGMDAFRDNEHERALTGEAIQRLIDGDDLEDLTNEDLERIVHAGKADGTNDRARVLAKGAQELLDEYAERDGMRQFQRDMEGGYDAYTGDMRLRDQMAEARKLK